MYACNEKVLICCFKYSSQTTTTMKALIHFTLLLIFGLILSTKLLFAQNYVEVGNGNTSNSMPIYSSWNYSWSSLIYNHTDLGAAKSITKIALNCINGPKTVTNQKVYAKLTSNSVFPTAGYEDPSNNGYVLVFQGNISFVNGWNEIELTTPITYDGVQNLVIHWENRWGTTYGPNFQSTPSVINNNKNCGSDASFPAPTQAGYLNPYPSSLTNMRFYYASTGPATPINPTPAHNSTNISVDTDLSWTLGANTTNYDLYLGLDPQNLPVVVANALATNGLNTYVIPGLLNDSIAYYWKVVAKNATQTESSPIWKFKTEYVIDQFPYNEGFEDSLVFNTFPVTSAWTIAPDVSWYQYNANPHSGLLCAKSSFYITGNTGTLRSPKVILPPSHTISFWWRNTSVNKLLAHDTTYFEVSSNGGTNWTKLIFLSPSSQNANYVKETIDLNSYAGNNFFFRFRRVTDNTASACNLYLDDISIFQSGVLPTLSVAPSNQNVAASAGNTSFSVITASAWTASSNQTWCSITPSGAGNGTIAATVSENTSLSQRVAEITVVVTGLTPVIVTVTQSPASPLLLVTPSNQNVTSVAGSATFSVTSNSSWVASSNQSWCAVTPSGSGNGSILATYDENPSLVSRVANITVTVAGLSPINVTITQEAALPYLSASPANQDVTFNAGTVNFSVNSNVEWTASSDAGWCVVTTAGSGPGTVFANYAENILALTRVAHITISASGVNPIAVTVSQTGPAATLSVTPNVQTVAYQAGIVNYVVTSNTSWTVSSDASWCVPTASGTGSGVINATYTLNESIVTRTANITINAAAVAPVLAQVIQLPSFVGVDKMQTPEISIYPNPVSEMLNVRIADFIKANRISIYNLIGELLVEQSINSTHVMINVSTLPTGTYLLKIDAEDKIYSRKVVIN